MRSSVAGTNRLGAQVSQVRERKSGGCNFGGRNMEQVGRLAQPNVFSGKDF